jgi:hypothetical protein
LGQIPYDRFHEIARLRPVENLPLELDDGRQHRAISTWRGAAILVGLALRNRFRVKRSAPQKAETS